MREARVIDAMRTRERRRQAAQQEHTEALARWRRPPVLLRWMMQRTRGAA
jgi:hypothetical protein